MRSWIEAMRLRTLPVSVAGVAMGIGLAAGAGSFRALPAALCLLFAIAAQIASNFANEYYDYRDGLDAPGREGPRRGVTEGDITPGAMLRATYLTLALACLIGLCLIGYGGWWLLPAGVMIAVGAMAYSAGPYPLSRHGLGEVAVVVFFGLVPVTLTFYVQALDITLTSVLAGLGVGLMGANVLVVNNYRDMSADAAVGKRTLAVIIGAPATRALYLINGLVAVGLTTRIWAALPGGCLLIPTAYIAAHLAIWNAMEKRTGRALTPLLGMTAMLMMAYCVATALAMAANPVM